MSARITIQQFTTLYLCLLAGLVCASEEKILQQVPNPQQANADVIVDTRPLASCRESALADAVCLPIEDFVAPQRRLANWSGILWLLGTAGLTGNEHVVVVGEKSNRRHLLAGLLAVAGQKKISIVDQPVSTLLATSLKNAENISAGSQRSTTRIAVFTVPMRSELLVLRNELETMIHENTVFLDGRSEAEYYGATIRAHRGGHIPGAIHSPLSEWRKTSNDGVISSTLPVSYAHDSIDGLTYFSALLSTGQPSRLYLGGWTEWASHGALPIDSASYPQGRHQLSDSSIAKTIRPALLHPNQINLLSVTVGAAIATGVLTLSFFGFKGFGRRQT